ncbi:MAG: hypothetical protein RSA12_08160, partial [Clostridia bacterium]
GMVCYPPKRLMYRAKGRKTLVLLYFTQNRAGCKAALLNLAEIFREPRWFSANARWVNFAYPTGIGKRRREPLGDRR